jgi:hypothetical protein
VRVILRAIIVLFASVSGAAAAASAETATVSTDDLGELVEACYESEDWACVFDNLMSGFEIEISRGGTCQKAEPRHPQDNMGPDCQFGFLFYYDFAVKASTGVEPERRREVAERFLDLMAGYKVPNDGNLAKGWRLGMNALRLDSCIELADEACRVESAARIVAVIDAASAGGFERITDAALNHDEFPLDLTQMIATARGIMEGSQP